MQVTSARMLLNSSELTSVQNDALTIGNGELSIAAAGTGASLTLDPTAVTSSGSFTTVCSATNINIYADFTNATFVNRAELRFVMHPRASAKVYLRFQNSVGELKSTFVMAEGSHVDVFTRIEGCSLALKLAAEMQEHAEAHFYGLTQATADQRTDVEVDVRHFQGQNLTEQKFYSFASENAIIAFTGKITVDNGAGGAVAHQLHRGTALSATARIDAKPFLNIRHDDVKCTHGSTVGFIDEAARHYLMARGMSQNEAETMLIKSSEQQFYSALPDERAAEFFGHKVGEQ